MTVTTHIAKEESVEFLGVQFGLATASGAFPITFEEVRFADYPPTSVNVRINGQGEPNEGESLWVRGITCP